MPYNYILYPSSLNKFYIGSTTLEPEQRLTKHLANHSGFTDKAKDWTIVYSEFFDTFSDARKRETQLKNWKSHLRIQQLIERSSTESLPAGRQGASRPTGREGFRCRRLQSAC